MLLRDHTVRHRNLREQHRSELVRLASGENANLSPQESSRILESHVQYLEEELTLSNPAVDLGQVQETLLEISQIIHYQRTENLGVEYGAIFHRLVRLYAQGIGGGAGDAFARTAADYAEVIEAIGWTCVDCEYNEAIGQLLHYMGQLFDSRKDSWMSVYEHIRALPDTSATHPALERECFSEVKQWVEEGVGNLFKIRRDLAARLQKLERELACLEEQIRAREDRIAAELGAEKAAAAAPVIDLGTRRRQRELLEWHGSRLRLVAAWEEDSYLLELIESNIREFEAKLKQLRRAYSLRLV